MTLDDIPLFSIIKGRLGYLSQRQQLISQNVANSDTPGFTPLDLKPFTLPKSAMTKGMQGGGGLAMALPQSGGAAGAGEDGGGSAPSIPLPAMRNNATPWTPQASPDSETLLDGNKVVLEDQMMKMSDSRLSYEAALGFYQKSIAMLQLAIRSPGKST
jgi:flagellar basal-body rod protein FlgB